MKSNYISRMTHFIIIFKSDRNIKIHTIYFMHQIIIYPFYLSYMIIKEHEKNNNQPSKIIFSRLHDFLVFRVFNLF